MPLDDVFELIDLLLLHVGGQEDSRTRQTVILEAQSGEESRPQKYKSDVSAALLLRVRHSEQSGYMSKKYCGI